MNTIGGAGGIFMLGLLVALVLVPVEGFRLEGGGQAANSTAAGLRVGFYSTTCPSVEKIILRAVAREFYRDPSVPGALLRLIFHDCFVRGCDASVLLDSVGGVLAEKDGRGVILRGLDVVDRIKISLEVACPGTVSCADILAFAARSSVVLTGGPNWAVEAGRRDGNVSLASEAGPPNMPVGVFDTETNSRIFAAKNFTEDEMVTLSGAHTIGQARCNTFGNRLVGPHSPDPTLDPQLATRLKSVCGPVPNNSTLVFLDKATPYRFDSDYFSNLAAEKGLLTSDQDLFTNERTRPLVLANIGPQSLFFPKFVDAMVKLAKVEVLTGSQGQIRQNCRRVNDA